MKKLEGSARIWVRKGSTLCFASVERSLGCMRSGVNILVVLASSSGIQWGFGLALDQVRLVGDVQRGALLSYRRRRCWLS
jgi:hypothetical protein